MSTPDTATSSPNPGPDSRHRASELVLRDLVDTIVQERLFGIRERAHPDRDVDPAVVGDQEVLAPGEFWCRIELGHGWLRCRARHSPALQPWRLSRGPVWYTAPDAPPEPIGPAELLRRLVEAAGGDLPGVHGVLADLGTAIDQAAMLDAQDGPGARRPVAGDLLAGERLAATRGRPFHPTARAVSGWTAAEFARLGPGRAQPLRLDWVAVRRTHLRHGMHPDSVRLHELLLAGRDRDVLSESLRHKGISLAEYQPIPVHPWQFEHVLRREFSTEIARGEIVEVVRGLAAVRPTASLRTLATEPRSHRHVKLPLGVATLGATRLLPPRYLDNGDRAQRTMADLLARDADLRNHAVIADESAWAGWQRPDGLDEFADRPGQLAAQVRTFPAELCADPAIRLLPMAALAAHHWDRLAPIVGLTGDPDPASPAADPGSVVSWFGALADGFTRLGLSFLRYGVLPELHGQNVLVAFRDGTPTRFVLRDHDTVRIFPGWLAAADVPDPAYRIKPGARQSLSLDSAEALVGYLQTLGFQVNLYGIADALAGWSGVSESVFWSRLRRSVTTALDELDLPGHVTPVLHRTLLDEPTWPSRRVLEPLLRQGNSAGVSMPAGLGEVPNPLLTDTDQTDRAGLPRGVSGTTGAVR